MNHHRKIIHVDMDAFYANIEIKENPELIGKPVIISGLPGSRSVVCTCSYEARKFGVRSGISADDAYAKCAHGIFILPNFPLYQAVSSKIMAIFKSYTDNFEPLSLDEAFLDITKNKKGIKSATLIAHNIQQEIFDVTGLTASVGVSFNKSIAKMASEYHKPNGITVVTPQNAEFFLDQQPVKSFFGVGRVFYEELKKDNILFGIDIRLAKDNLFIEKYGKKAVNLINIMELRDNRPVISNRIRKSIGAETTFSKDTINQDYIFEKLAKLVAEVEETLRIKDIGGKTVTLKIKYYDFKSVTRSTSLTRDI